jgi:hypothetical protein
VTVKIVTVDSLEAWDAPDESDDTAGPGLVITVRKFSDDPGDPCVTRSGPPALPEPPQEHALAPPLDAEAPGCAGEPPAPSARPTPTSAASEERPFERTVTLVRRGATLRAIYQLDTHTTVDRAVGPNDILIRAGVAVGQRVRLSDLAPLEAEERVPSWQREWRPSGTEAVPWSTIDDLKRGR